MRQIGKRIGVFILAALVLGFAGHAMALDKFEAELKVKEAAILVEKFMTSPDSGAPHWMLKRAKAVILIPNMVKAGFVVGGKYGHGVVCVRKADGSWSEPSFMVIAGANVGFQIGAESMDLFMFVMRERGLEGVLKNQVKFGVDASVAAGPVGRTAEASLSAASLSADVYSYSRAQGAFAGATVGAAGLEVDEDTNKSYYGKDATSKEILQGGKVVAPEAARHLMEVLARYSK
ncbi:lipid-binding SYLF domain-containing protein [Dethiosulfatarculus sandiegensis]|uniref:Ysc84 actin-binding domain-containing protein n=1 Tax=Dethiosulfatarculus sandiegensis TaxID=1429043 RepID=A0A0D2HKA8_9BACT|nr:lipid-binding SYLF domain-containing protein [Dethiosulfatarculus sandiegensis]KIX11063.1 hypothetical protein X474_25225 [Dethiosulfatarculus sandiegensis]